VPPSALRVAMPPAVPLHQFLAPQKASWADDEPTDEPGAGALPAVPAYSAAAAPPLPSYASKPIPTSGPFVVYVGNVSYDLQQARPAGSSARLAPPRLPACRVSRGPTAPHCGG
jgi:hypothetical protein